MISKNICIYCIIIYIYIHCNEGKLDIWFVVYSDLFWLKLKVHRILQALRTKTSWLRASRGRKVKCRKLELCDSKVPSSGSTESTCVASCAMAYGTTKSEKTQPAIGSTAQPAIGSAAREIEPGSAVVFVSFKTLAKALASVLAIVVVVVVVVAAAVVVVTT